MVLQHSSFSLHLETAGRTRPNGDHRSNRLPVPELRWARVPAASIDLSGTIRIGRQSLSMLMTSDRSARAQLAA
jgi:hypothetical protein